MRGPSRTRPHGYSQPGPRAEASLRRRLAILGLLAAAALTAFLVLRSCDRASEGPEAEDLALEPVATSAPALLEASPPLPPPAAETPPTDAPRPEPGPERDLLVRVKTTSGKPVADATVFVEDTDPTAHGAVTNEKGVARLRARVSSDWVLVRTQGSVWGRASLRPASTDVVVAVSDEIALLGRAVDPWGRPAADVRLRVRGVGRENPARAWPGVRRWEMRAEVTEVVTDKGGRFRVSGLESDRFEVEAERGELLDGEHGRATFARDSAQTLVVGEFGYGLVSAVDAVSRDPIPRIDVVVAAPPAQVPRDTLRLVARLSAGVLVRWPRAADGAPESLAVRLEAPGYQATTATIVGISLRAGPLREATPVTHDDGPVPMTRSTDAREGRTRLRMPAGVLSPVPLLVGSMRSIGRDAARAPATGHLRNLRGLWDVEGVGGVGRWSVSGFFGLEVPDVERRTEGESVEIDMSGAPWGPLVFHLTADADLCRGEFDVTATDMAGSDYRFRVTADEDGHANAGWWPAGPWTFRVHRSAESCTPQLVSVRPSTEPTVVEFAVENLLTR